MVRCKKPHLFKIVHQYLFSQCVKTHVYDLSFTEDDLIVRDKMATWWTNFAKNGSPDGESLWQPFTPRYKLLYYFQSLTLVLCKYFFIQNLPTVELQCKQYSVKIFLFKSSSPAYMNINPTPTMEYSDRYVINSHMLDFLTKFFTSTHTNCNN